LCEGVLQRHESLAANLGAKLVGPLLIKSFDKIFEGPIKVLQAKFGAEPTSVAWLDVIDFARANPSQFTLIDSGVGTRVCQFWIKQCLVEISEDDYRLILSGAPERMIPKQPIADDEAAEIATIDILELRLSALIRKADTVAARARQLNYHLKGRKTAIQNERSERQPDSSIVTSSPFQPVNSIRAVTNGENLPSLLHQDLLRQFLTQEISTSHKPVPSRSKTSHHKVVDPHSTPSDSKSHPPASDRRMSSLTPSQTTGLSSSLPAPGSTASTIEELTGGHYRPLMAAKNDKLQRGDSIWPPCDRCRRLRMECTKYLTACTGCTKKHAKCTWNDITEDEVGYLVANAGGGGEAGAGGPAGSEGSGGSRPGSVGGGDDNGNGNDESMLDPQGTGGSNGIGNLDVAGAATNGANANAIGSSAAEPQKASAEGEAYREETQEERERRILSKMAETAAAASALRRSPSL
jgi:hypothetical protein